MRRVASRRQFESPPIAEMAHPTHPIAQTRRSGRGGVRRPGAIRGDRGGSRRFPSGGSARSVGQCRPRLGGGSPCCTTFIVWAIGQSPHVRGSRRPLTARRPCPWSIPACAGEPLGNSLSDQTTDRLWAGRRVRSCLDPIIEKGEVITGQTHVDGLTVYAQTTPSPCIFSAINAGAKGRWPALSLLT